MARVLTGERRRLAEVVEQSPFQVLLLRGPGLLVETMNPRLSMLFEGTPAAGRPFEEICVDRALEAVRVGVRRAHADAKAWQSVPLRLAAGAERWLQFLAVPTHDAEGAVDGVALYVEDVTERQRASR